MDLQAAHRPDVAKVPIPGLATVTGYIQDGQWSWSPILLTHGHFWHGAATGQRGRWAVWVKIGRARPDPMPASQTGKTLSADAFAGDAIIVAVKLAAPGAVLQIPARLCAAADLAAGPAWAAGPVLTGQFVKS